MNDFAFVGNVELPNNAVIVKYNNEVPQGKLRISKDDETGIKIVETSESNVSKTAETIIKKMGYTTFKDLVKSDENITGNDIESARNGFCKKENYINMLATYLPHHQADSLFPALYFLSFLDDWIGTDVTGVDLDYKQELLNVIKDIKKNNTANIPLSFDITKLEGIFEESDAPEEAYKKVQDEFDFYFIPNEINSLFSPTKDRQTVIEDIKKNVFEEIYKSMEENYIKVFGKDSLAYLDMDEFMNTQLKGFISGLVRNVINISTESDDNRLLEMPDIIEEFKD